MKASNGLTSGIVLNELQSTGYIYFGFFFCYFLFFKVGRLGAGTATVTNDIADITEECRMAMEVDFAIFWLVPFCV